MKDDEAVRMFEIAHRAYRAEMGLCIRDRKLWIEQFMMAAIGLAKIGVMLVILPMAIWGALGLPSVLGLIIGIILLPFFLIFAPEKICVNLFQKRAWAAFDAELARLRLEASQSAPTKIEA